MVHDLVIHVPPYKANPKFFQQRTGKGNLNHFHTFQSSWKTKASIHRVTYIRILVNLIRLFNCNFTTLVNADNSHFTTYDSADNRCKLLFLFDLIKYHQITGWNLLISSHMMQCVLLSEIKLCSTFTSLFQRHLLIWNTMGLLTQTCLEAPLESQQKQHMESIEITARWLRLLSALSKAWKPHWNVLKTLVYNYNSVYRSCFSCFNWTEGKWLKLHGSTRCWANIGFVL